MRVYRFTDDSEASLVFITVGVEASPAASSSPTPLSFSSPPSTTPSTVAGVIHVFRFTGLEDLLIDRPFPPFNKGKEAHIVSVCFVLAQVTPLYYAVGL